MSHPLPSRRWRNADGRAASLYGAAPLGEGWTIETSGWTVKHSDGTIGIGRVPFASEAEAQAWCDAHPTFSGMRA